MKAKFVNTTHRTIKVSEGVSLPPNSAQTLEIPNTNKINELIKLGIIQVLPADGKKVDRSLMKGTSAMEATKMRRNALADRLRAANAKLNEKTDTVSLQSNTKTVKASASVKTTNTKGK